MAVVMTISVVPEIKKPFRRMNRKGFDDSAGRASGYMESSMMRAPTQNDRKLDIVVIISRPQPSVKQRGYRPAAQTWSVSPSMM